MKELEQIALYDVEYRKFAVKLTGCKYQADDLVQEMYMRLAKQKYDDKFDAKKYKYYCCLIINQIFISQIRKDDVRKRKENEIPEIEPRKNYSEIRKVLGCFLWRLDKYDRYIIYLYAIKNFGIFRMQQELGINRGSIQYSIWKTRKKAENLPQKQRQILKKALNP